MTDPASVATLTLRIATPYLLAAAGGVLAERAGVVSLALEGYMLGGACGAAFGAFYLATPLAGIAGGLAAGAALGGLHALVTIRYRGNQIVSGIAINLLVIGLTRFALRVAFGSSSNSPRVPGIAGSLGDPLLWIGLAVLPVMAWVIAGTPFGLRVRAVGDRPAAAVSAGISVARVRTVAVIASGMLAALGGTYLALDQHQFTDEMTAGRGFIALAAVIFGGWRPFPAAAACLLFAAAEALEIQLQTTSGVPSQLLATIPYVLTIVALAGLVGRSVPPAALGEPL
jgi:ABC-type uncharacterized transport system permease subunit